LLELGARARLGIELRAPKLGSGLESRVLELKAELWLSLDLS
jgi:hypothetical protein